jgi:hypothetical protein
MNSITKTLSGKLLRVLTVFSFILIGYAAKAQEQKEVKDITYIITDKGTITNIQPYIDALGNSDMKYHRLLNKRNTIVFQTGLKVELFSANEIAKKGIQINLSEYPEYFDHFHQEPVFAVAPNNFIIEYHIAASKHN